MLHQSFHFRRINQAFEIEHLDHPLYSGLLPLVQKQLSLLSHYLQMNLAKQ